MKPILPGELYQHLSSFLKSKGIDLQDGSYTRRIEKGCHLLTKTINVTQNTVEKAKAEVKTQLKKAKRVVHEKTAPTPDEAAATATGTSAPPPAAEPPPAAAAKPAKPRRATRAPTSPAKSAKPARAASKKKA